MARGLVTDTYLTDIADAIRTKNGTETQYKPSEMANAISNIKTKFKINDLKFRDYKGTVLDLSFLDTSDVTDMSDFFRNCTNLVQLNISNWDTSSVTAVYEMFEGCTKLEMLDLSNWDITSFTSSFDMFNNCGSDLSTPTTVYVKDETVQQWILDKTSYSLNWSTANVIIKNQ